MSIAPVWFISHGAPDLVLRDQPATRFLKQLRLEGARGLVVISAHWFSRSELQINVEPNPALMYDFYGFPEPLYQIRWPATSPQWLQEAVSDQLLLAGLPATPVRRELDHGVWSPLSLMDPDSELPLVQIAILDIIFSLDSVITAVGMADHVPVMVLAIIIAVGVMMFAAKAIGDFVDTHPTIKMLALSFLILVGVALMAEGLDLHIPKGYIYFAMAFSLVVEMINIRLRGHQERAK